MDIKYESLYQAAREPAEFEFFLGEKLVPGDDETEFELSGLHKRLSKCLGFDDPGSYSFFTVRDLEIFFPGIFHSQSEHKKKRESRETLLLYVRTGANYQYALDKIKQKKVRELHLPVKSLRGEFLRPLAKLFAEGVAVEGKGKKKKKENHVEQALKALEGPGLALLGAIERFKDGDFSANPIEYSPVARVQMNVLLSYVEGEVARVVGQSKMTGEDALRDLYLRLGEKEYRSSTRLTREEFSRELAERLLAANKTLGDAFDVPAFVKRVLLFTSTASRKIAAIVDLMLSNNQGLGAVAQIERAMLNPFARTRFVLSHYFREEGLAEFCLKDTRPDIQKTLDGYAMMVRKIAGKGSEGEDLIWFEDIFTATALHAEEYVDYVVGELRLPDRHAVLPGLTDKTIAEIFKQAEIASDPFSELERLISPMDTFGRFKVRMRTSYPDGKIIALSDRLSYLRTIAPTLGSARTNLAGDSSANWQEYLDRFFANDETIKDLDSVLHSSVEYLVSKYGEWIGLQSLAALTLCMLLRVRPNYQIQFANLWNTKRYVHARLMGREPDLSLRILKGEWMDALSTRKNFPSELSSPKRLYKYNRAILALLRYESGRINPDLYPQPTDADLSAYLERLLPEKEPADSAERLVVYHNVLEVMDCIACDRVPATMTLEGYFKEPDLAVPLDFGSIVQVLVDEDPKVLFKPLFDVGPQVMFAYSGIVSEYPKFKNQILVEHFKSDEQTPVWQFLLEIIQYRVKGSTQKAVFFSKPVNASFIDRLRNRSFSSIDFENDANRKDFISNFTQLAFASDPSQTIGSVRRKSTLQIISDVRSHIQIGPVPPETEVLLESMDLLSLFKYAADRHVCAWMCSAC